MVSTIDITTPDLSNGPDADSPVVEVSPMGCNGMSSVTFEQRLDARQAIIDLDHFAGQSVEPRFEAAKPVVQAAEAILNAAEAGVDIRFEACHARTERSELKHAADHGHNDREYGYTDREIHLSIRHVSIQLYRPEPAWRYTKKVPFL